MDGELAQSVGIVEFFSSLGAGAIVIFLVWQGAEMPMGYLDSNAQLATVQQSHEWTATLLTYLPVVFLLIAVIGSISFVVYQTRFV